LSAGPNAREAAVTGQYGRGSRGAAQAGLGNSVLLDDQNALAGRRLFENTVGLEEKGVANWTSPGAADKTEWVSQVRTTSTLFGPYQLQEDAHPNYCGQVGTPQLLAPGIQRRRGTRRRLHHRVDRAQRLRRTADEFALAERGATARR
jgi:hypothetical protein